MLDIIRSNAQAFWVKVAFGVIILVFVFWGIGSFTDTGFVNVLGTVNDEPITYQQFEETYRMAEQDLVKNQQKRALTADQKAQLGRQVFQSMVSEVLINQEAKRIGLGVSPYELRLYVGSLQVFQNEKGQFDPELYKKVLAARRQSPASFEADLTRRLLHDKMVMYVSAGSWTDSIEARNRFNFLRQKRAIEYVYMPAASAVADMPEPDEAACTKFYEEHKTDYVIPQKAEVQYIIVDPLKSVSPDSISAEKARAYYDKNVAAYTEPEKIEVSHILVPLEKNATEEVVKLAMDKALKIKKEIADGMAFAAAADKYNGPNAADKGGKLGWITAGVTVPEFEKAAFAAEKGVVTDPVRSQFGLHLILVTDKKAASVKPYESVEKDIKAELAAIEGKAGLSDLLDTLTEENILGKDMAEVASSHGLKAETTGLMSREDLQSKLGITADGAKAIMGIGAKQPVDTPLEAGSAYVVARVLQTAPSSFKPLADVKADIVKRIRTNEGMGKAKAALEDVLKKAGAGDLPSEWAAKAKVSELFGRDSAIAPFAAQADLERAVFSAEPGKWLSTVFTVSTKDDSGVLICRVKQTADPEDAEWQQVENIMTSLTQRERANGVVMSFMESLFNKAKVVIRNQDIIDRKNM